MATPEAYYKCPAFEPYSNPNFDGTWIRIGAYEVEHFTAWAKDESGGVRIKGDEVTSWAFLAPDQILETVNHSWQPWETIASRLSGFGKQMYEQLSNDVGALADALVSQSKGVNVNKFMNALQGDTKAKWKVDTPLVYEDSERREYTLEFQLVSREDGDGHWNMEMVRVMEQYSSPDRDGIVSIKLPYIFKVETFPEADIVHSVLNIPYAAITSVQPTYMAPYDKYGFPMRILLTVTFKELPPLYADSFVGEYNM